MYVNLKLNLTYPLEMPINKRSIRLSIAHTLTVIRLSRLFFVCMIDRTWRAKYTIYSQTQTRYKDMASLS